LQMHQVLLPPSVIQLDSSHQSELIFVITLFSNIMYEIVSEVIYFLASNWTHDYFQIPFSTSVDLALVLPSDPEDPEDDKMMENMTSIGS
jgi:hypothetical protein